MTNGIIITMKNPELSSILEECICQLQGGADLEEVLAQYPEYTRELRPLLETAAEMKYHRSRLKVPADAQAKSRYSFVSGATARPQQRGFFHPLHLRLAITAIVIVALVFGLLSTGLVSASSLPGDTLYPVKLTLEQIQLSTTSSISQRLSLQEQFDEVRAQEVNQLTDTNRSATVTFSGIPAKMNGDWLVAGIKLDVTQQDSQMLDNLQGYVVQVTGETQGNTVKVNRVQPKELTFSGTIDGIQPDYWVVAGVKVGVDEHLVTGTEPNIGQQVNVTAVRQDNGNLVASHVDMVDSGEPTQVIRGTNEGPTNTPDQEQNQPGFGKGDAHGGTSGERGITPTPDTNSGDSNQSTSMTPTPRVTQGDDSGTRQPDHTEQHHDNPTLTSSHNQTPQPDHHEGSTPNP
jgi:hypothetical protein